MHKYFYVPMFCLMACSSDKHEFSNSDFAGKIFSVKMSADKVSNVTGKPVDAKAQMIFGGDSTTKMRVMFGSEFRDVPSFWRVENDSMVFWSDNLPKEKLRISKEPNGFMLTDSSHAMLFIQE